MAFKKGVAAAAVFATALLPTTAGSVTRTIHLRGHVPLYCNVSFLPTIGAGPVDDIIHLGASQELCNAPRGYRVILQHPANMSGAAVISDNNRIPLSDSGETIVSNSDQPGFHIRNLALDLGEDAGHLDRLGLRIEVKY